MNVFIEVENDVVKKISECSNIRKYGIRALYNEIRNLIEIPVSEKIFENASENNNFLVSLYGKKTKISALNDSQTYLIENKI